MPKENMTNIVPNVIYLIGRYLFFSFSLFISEAPLKTKTNFY